MTTHTPLPHADAIRTARAVVASCQEALLLYQHLKTARTALSILDVQRASGMVIPPELPGEDIIQEAARQFSQLRDLGTMYPHQSSAEVRLRVRMQQLDLVEQSLSPQLERNEEASAELHTLQHHQHHALEAPEWAAEVEALRALGAGRDRLSLEMAPVQHQLSLVEPVREMLAGFHPQLQDELVMAARTDDPLGIVAWRAAMIAHQQLVGLAQVIEQLGLVVQYPFEPMLPDEPHPRHRRRLRQEAGGVLEWMQNLDQALSDHSSVLSARMDVLKGEHGHLERELQEWMG